MYQQQQQEPTRPLSLSCFSDLVLAITYLEQSEEKNSCCQTSSNEVKIHSSSEQLIDSVNVQNVTTPLVDSKLFLRPPPFSSSSSSSSPSSSPLLASTNTNRSLSSSLTVDQTNNHPSRSNRASTVSSIRSDKSKPPLQPSLTTRRPSVEYLAPSKPCILTTRHSINSLPKFPTQHHHDSSSFRELQTMFPGTAIRKSTEPELTDSMRTLLKQFSGRYNFLQDHKCIGYPIYLFLGSYTMETNYYYYNVNSSAISLFFGAGHPKNMAALLPQQEEMKSSTRIDLSKRAQLCSIIHGLETVLELYNSQQVCAHIGIDSSFVAKAWATWIPEWELTGWPGGNRSKEKKNGTRTRKHQCHHHHPRKNSTCHGLKNQRQRQKRYDNQDDSTDSYDSYEEEEEEDNVDCKIHATTGKLVNEDLLKQLSKVRNRFAHLEKEKKASAHLYLVHRVNNPADRMARSVVLFETRNLCSSHTHMCR